MSILRVRDKDGNIQEILTIRGEQGERGPKGDAPVRGVDYYTETDKQEIIEDVLENVNIGITEDNFYDLLSEQANDPDSILSSTYANTDSVNELEELIVYNYVSWDNIDVDGGVASHEALEDLKDKTETNYWGYLPTNEFDMMLQEKIEDEDSDLNVKYATNDWVEEIRTDIGYKETAREINVGLDNIYYGGYYNWEDEWVEDENCRTHYFDISTCPELAGKTVKIRTYMFGDMWVGCSDDGDSQKSNTAALGGNPNDTRGIFECTFTFCYNGDYDIPSWLYVPFYTNPYMENPEIFFYSEGNVWDELFRVENQELSEVKVAEAISRALEYETGPIDRTQLAEAVMSTEAFSSGMTDAFLECFDGHAEYAADKILDVCMIPAEEEGMQGKFAEAVLAVLPIYNGEYSVEVV